MYRTDFWTLWEKARVGCLKRTASKHVYYLWWNRSPAQAGCMRQVLRPGALGRPRGIGWRERWEGGLGWGIHVYPWLIHVNVWQKPLQYCKAISLQLIKINETNKQKKILEWNRVATDLFHDHGLRGLQKELSPISYDNLLSSIHQFIHPFRAQSAFNLSNFHSLVALPFLFYFFYALPLSLYTCF